MAAENEIQFFEAPFQYQIGEFKSNVNLTYHKLINTVPIKMPQLNTGFEAPFSQVEREKGDKSYFGITKRKGFVNCADDFNTKLRHALGGNYIITDHQIIDGKRFVMACNDEYTKMCVMYLPEGNSVDCMKQPSDICKAEREPKGQSASGADYRSFRTTPCAYHKFQKIPTLQVDNQDNQKTLTSVYIGNVVWKSGAQTAVLYNSKREFIDGLKLGKYVQLFNSKEDNDIVIGQALQVGQFETKYGWYNMGYGEWVGVTDERKEPIYDEDGNEIGTLNYQGPVTAYVYDGIKMGIAFAGTRTTSSGDERNGIWEWDGTRFVFQYQTRLNNTQITSLTEDFDGLVYTTDRGVLNFMRPHDGVMGTLGGTIYSSHQLYGNWDLAKACGDYIFLFGPDTMGIAYKNGTDERGDYRWNIQVLDRNMGYWNKDSVLVYNEEMYMIDNKKRFVKLDLEATTDSYYRVHFKLTATDMSLHWINTDLRNLDRHQGQKVSLCKDETKIYIIINDSYDTFDTSDYDKDEELNTKILVYEDELKYRHRRYLCDVDIRGFHDGQWFGRGLYKYEGEKDLGKPFKQIISMTFGDTSWFTWKEVLWIKAAIGYHSQISENTIFKFRADGGGFSTTFKMTDMHKTSNYIKAINSLRESGKTDLNNLQELYRAMPIGIGIYSGNGIGLIKDKYRTVSSEFEQFCNYEPTLVYKKDTCCDPKPASEADDNECTMKAPDPNAENFGSDRFQYHYNIAKYSTLKINVGQQGQNFFFELIANEYDSIEFCGFMVGRMFMDNNFDSIANTPYYQTTPTDSLPGMMGK